MRLFFHKKGAAGYPDPVESIGAADVFAHGFVKWDGCSNWTINEAGWGVMLHACDKEGLTRIGLILGECWDMTRELCEKWIND